MGRRKLKDSEKKIQLSVKVLSEDVSAIDRDAQERGVKRADVLRCIIKDWRSRQRADLESNR